MKQKPIEKEVAKSEFDKAESKVPYVDVEAETRKRLLAENPRLRIPK